MDSQPGSELRKTCDSPDVFPKNPLRPSVSRKSMVRPFDFSAARKLHIVVAGIYFVFNSSLGSSLPSGAHDAIADYFYIPQDDLKMVLPTSLYMAGFAIGPLIFGPLSERFGRKPILVTTFAIYNLFTMACALAPTFPALLIFRFLCGLGGSAPNAVLGGLFSDIYNDPHQRGMVMSIFMFATTFPPLLGPIISGFVSTVSWRWTFWAGFIIGGVGFPLVLVMPETYMPVLPGSILAFVLFCLYSSYHTKALKNGLAWAKVEEYRRLPLACVAAPAIPIALFWLGWSSRSSIHPVMPMMSGVFFGFGYLLIFIALLNYLTDAYKQYSASASAAASTLRSIFAVCLPLATTPMYTKLGIDWASSLLGFFAIAMAIIPFVFIKYGSWIRENSKFAQRAAQGYTAS
ncbi:major facilitator superfamily domain-containing protein [Aspergillus parasiticus]|uniref:Major facilitator superfamily domain-containing protein n=1 Tax=Aspergillus parasiticus TaxID=5067 RepID=A0A5N6DSM6_ASPPA|nr:major facilitator superfamily domain-containing protein [Aspergillus parasiticus]